MTDETHSNGTENRTDDQQHAREACEHALHNGDLAHARTLLEEARTAVERAQSDATPPQEQRDIAFDCYD